MSLLFLLQLFPPNYLEIQKIRQTRFFGAKAQPLSVLCLIREPLLREVLFCSPRTNSIVRLQLLSRSIRFEHDFDVSQRGDTTCFFQFSMFFSCPYYTTIVVLAIGQGSASQAYFLLNVLAMNKLEWDQSDFFAMLQQSTINN